MNWLQKISAPIRTQDFPEVLAQAIAFECGGEWDVGEATNWTENLESIHNKYHDTPDTRLSDEKGYSTSFWVTCKEGDGYFQKKWGVSVNFTVLSGSSHTTFDSETGDWDFLITANVQRAADASWTPASPYALMMEAVGAQEDMKTIQETALFVKNAIWNSQRGDDGPDEPEVDPEPDPGVGAPVSSELTAI